MKHTSITTKIIKKKTKQTKDNFYLTYSEASLKKYLNTYFGFKDFRRDQLVAIQSILEGNDTFIIMPTGGGKSLCYQLPALVAGGCTIVLSPLIALMKNQVDLVRTYSNENHIAHFLNSTLNKSKIREVKEDIISGKTKILYVAPETLVKQENIDFFKEIKISFFAIDEAHCISEWGHDFRPEYRKIREIVNGITTQVPIVALTATATPKVQQDIIKNLELKNPRTLISSFDRSNLYYEVQHKSSKEQVIKHIIKLIGQKKNSSCIVYVLSRKSTEEVTDILNANNISTVAYHAGLDSKTRNERQDLFLKKQVQVIVATIAFGMGIDKPDIRYVFHYNIPKSIENYYQETGRAGRDGIASKCVLFYAHSDFLKLEYLIKQKPLMHREIMAKLIEEMGGFVENGACRRKFLLNYFGENYPKENCGHCDNCINPKSKIEAKIEATLLLKVIHTTQEAFTFDHILNILYGNPTSKIQMHDHQHLQLFGKGKRKDILFWNSLLIQMSLNRMIIKDMVQFGVLKITDTGLTFMNNPKSFKITLNHTYQNSIEDSTQSDDNIDGIYDIVLFEKLYKLRQQQSEKEQLPDYIIFSENTLIDMATLYPTSLAELEKCQGVNKSKATKFGTPFIKIIEKYISKVNIKKPHQEVVLKSSSVGNKLKLNIIQLIDKKIPLQSIADSNKIKVSDLLLEMQNLCMGGTKLNIDYILNEEFSDRELDDLIDYLKESNTGNIEEVQEAFESFNYTLNQLQLVKIKFINDFSS